MNEHLQEALLHLYPAHEGLWTLECGPHTGWNPAIATWDAPVPRPTQEELDAAYGVLAGRPGEGWEWDGTRWVDTTPPPDVVLSANGITVFEADALGAAARTGEKTAAWLIAKLGL